MHLSALTEPSAAARVTLDYAALALPGNFSVDRLMSMLNLIWPNRDRHGCGVPTAVTFDQAQAVVNLAVTVVQWGRAGVLKKR